MMCPAGPDQCWQHLMHECLFLRARRANEPLFEPLFELELEPNFSSERLFKLLNCSSARSSQLFELELNCSSRDLFNVFNVFGMNFQTRLFNLNCSSRIGFNCSSAIVRARSSPSRTRARSSRLFELEPIVRALLFLPPASTRRAWPKDYMLSLCLNLETHAPSASLSGGRCSLTCLDIISDPGDRSIERSIDFSISISSRSRSIDRAPDLSIFSSAVSIDRSSAELDRSSVEKLIFV